MNDEQYETILTILMGLTVLLPEKDKKLLRDKLEEIALDAWECDSDDE